MRPMPASGIQLYRILIGLKNKQHSFCMLHGPVVNWISTQHWTSLCTGFFDRENNGENNEFPLGLACYLIKFGVIKKSFCQLSTENAEKYFF